jgi:hypothetical protein
VPRAKDGWHDHGGVLRQAEDLQGGRRREAEGRPKQRHLVHEEVQERTIQVEIKPTFQPMGKAVGSAFP